MKKKMSDKERGKLKKTSHKFAASSGFLMGLSKTAVHKKTGKVGPYLPRAKGKLGGALATAGVLSSLAATATNIKSSESLGDFIRTGFRNIGSSMLGHAGGSLTGMAAAKGGLRLRKAVKKAKLRKAKRPKKGKVVKSAADKRKASRARNLTPQKALPPGKGKTRFIRVRGRIIPIKGK